MKPPISQFVISDYLDERRPLKDNTFPLKLRVYNSNNQETKLISLKIKISKEDYASLQKKKVPKQLEEVHFTLTRILLKANEVAKTIDPFTISEFEKKFFKKSLNKDNVIEYYLAKIAELEQNEQFKTASSYRSSLLSIMRFINPPNPDKVKNLSFLDINKSWLDDFEKFLIREGKSISTVGIYLRPLRAVFNLAIRDNPRLEEIYPFSKNNYQIPTARRIKKSLNSHDLRILFESSPESKNQEFAKDFWFFIYSCNGINVNDIARLKIRDLDLKHKFITFFRGKTYKTTRSDLVEIKIYLNDYALSILNKYANTKGSPDDLLFPIVNKDDTEADKKRKIDNFNRKINQHIKPLAASVGLSADISVYWARHSFSNMALNKGANIEFIGEALGHKDVKTTKNYISGFEDRQKREISGSIMNFDEVGDGI